MSTSFCRYCGKPIVFKPYFADGKLPNEPVWWHPPGSLTCSTRPSDWPESSWPKAAPISEAGACPICGSPEPRGTREGTEHIATHSREELIAATTDLADQLAAAIERVKNLGIEP